MKIVLLDELQRRFEAEDAWWREQGRGFARQELGGVGNGKAGCLARGLEHCPDSGALQLRLAQVADAASSHTRPGCA